MENIRKSYVSPSVANCKESKPDLFTDAQYNAQGDAKAGVVRISQTGKKVKNVTKSSYIAKYGKKIVSFVMKGSSKHGVKVTLKSYMRTVHKGGKTYKVEAWKITNTSSY